MKMNFIQSLFFIFVIFSFFVGLLFYTYPNTPYLKFLETMDSMESELNSNTFSSNELDASLDAPLDAPLDTELALENNDAELNMNLDLDMYATQENVDSSVYMDEQNASAQNQIDNSNEKQMNVVSAKDEGEDEDEYEDEYEEENQQNVNSSSGIPNNEIKPMNILPTPTLVSTSVLYSSTPSSKTSYPSLKNGTSSPRGAVQQNRIPNAHAKRNVSGAVISSAGGQPAMGPIAPQFGETVQKLQPVQNVNALNRQNPYQSTSQSSSQQDGGIYENGFPSFKESDYNAGTYSYLDALRDSNRGSSYSDNPMDSNWGGVEWSRNAVESGKYNDRLVVPHAISNGFSTSSRFNKQPLNVFA